MSVSQHEQNLYGFLIASFEVSVEEFLELFNGFANLIYRNCLRVSSIFIKYYLQGGFFSFIVEGLCDLFYPLENSQ